MLQCCCAVVPATTFVVATLVPAVGQATGLPGHWVAESATLTRCESLDSLDCRLPALRCGGAVARRRGGRRAEAAEDNSGRTAHKRPNSKSEISNLDSTTRLDSTRLGLPARSRTGPKKPLALHQRRIKEEGEEI